MLFGNSQEGDCSMIADLVVSKLEIYCKPVQAAVSMSKTASATTLSHYSHNGGGGAVDGPLQSRPSPTPAPASGGNSSPQPPRNLMMNQQHGGIGGSQSQQPSPNRQSGAGSFPAQRQQNMPSANSAGTANERLKKSSLLF